MHYYLSPAFENYYFSLLINSFIISCAISYGATKNENLKNVLAMTNDIEPVDRYNYA
jgi:hypothetical protein